MTVALGEVVKASARREVLLTPELAGYLLLGVVDRLVTSPVAVSVANVALSDDGSVTVTGAARTAETEAVAQLRAILRTLLAVTRPSGGAVSRVAAGKATSVIGLVSELEAALIPVNRSAARRALIRVYRDAVRARRLGKLEDLASAPPQAPEFSEVSVPVRSVEPAAVSVEVDVDEFDVDVVSSEPPADQFAPVSPDVRRLPTPPGLPEVTERVPVARAASEPPAPKRDAQPAAPRTLTGHPFGAQPDRTPYLGSPAAMAPSGRANDLGPGTDAVGASTPVGPEPKLSFDVDHDYSTEPGPALFTEPPPAVAPFPLAFSPRPASAAPMPGNVAFGEVDSPDDDASRQEEPAPDSVPPATGETAPLPLRVKGLNSEPKGIEPAPEPAVAGRTPLWPPVQARALSTPDSPVTQQPHCAPHSVHLETPCEVGWTPSSSPGSGTSGPKTPDRPLEAAKVPGGSEVACNDEPRRPASPGRVTARGAEVAPASAAPVSTAAGDLPSEAREPAPAEAAEPPAKMPRETGPVDASSKPSLPTRRPPTQPPRFYEPRKSDLDDLLKTFNLNVTRSDEALSRDLKRLVDLDLTPQGANTCTGTPPPVALGDDDPVRERRAPRKRPLLVVLGAAGLVVGLGGGEMDLRTGRTGESGSQAWSGAKVKAKPGSDCAARLEVHGVPAGDRLRIRPAFGTSFVPAERVSAGAVVTFADLPCSEPVELTIRENDHEPRWLRIPVAGAALTPKRGESNAIHRLLIR